MCCTIAVALFMMCYIGVQTCLLLSQCVNMKSAKLPF